MEEGKREGGKRGEKRKGNGPISRRQSPGGDSREKKKRAHCRQERLHSGKNKNHKNQNHTYYSVQY
jgi:hypothetical protein